jgi:HEAT repeat protein
MTTHGLGRLAGWLIAVIAMAPGCAGPAATTTSRQDGDYRREAVQHLKRAIRFPDNPVIRAQAIEAFQDMAPMDGLVWIREATRDPVPGVRFAACMGLGTLRDQVSKELLLTRVEDVDPSVRVAAIFGLHRLGDYGHSSELADYLLNHQERMVRANAATALGRLGETKAVPLLRKADRDEEEIVRMQALEARALLQDEAAIKDLLVMTHGYAGEQQAFACMVLGQAGVVKSVDALRLRLRDGPHLETKLVAARALAMVGHADGAALSRKMLSYRPPALGTKATESPEILQMRIRSLAALAIGALGERSSLAALGKLLKDDGDPRVQVAVARSMLEILERSERAPWTSSRQPVAQSGNAGRDPYVRRPAEDGP